METIVAIIAIVSTCALAVAVVAIVYGKRVAIGVKRADGSATLEVSQKEEPHA